MYLQVVFVFFGIYKLQHNVECEKPPNILIFLADDLGIGDVGCFGNDTINTSNLDRICQNGMKLTHNLAPAPLCTPSRAAFLTSRYPIRSGAVSDQYIPVYLHSTGSGGLPTNETTFATMLKTANYTNGYFGKWHQGIHGENENDFQHFPLNHGFDYYYGMPLTNLQDCAKMPHFKGEDLEDFGTFSSLFASLFGFMITFIVFKKQLGKWYVFPLFLGIAVWYYQNIIWFLIERQFNCIVMRNYKVVQQPVNLETFTTTLTNEAKEFIKRNNDNNFLAVVAYQKVHIALSTASEFVGKSNHGKYGDTVEEMDWSVGEIMQTLEDLNLVDDTFVYFSSDHGPALYASVDGKYHGGSKGILKGGKGTNWEGGIRVPTMVQYPGIIPAGTVYDKPTSLMDVFPTIASMASVSINLEFIDGKDMMSILTGNQEMENRFLFHYGSTNIQAVTYSSVDLSKVWKIHYSIAKFVNGTELCQQGLCYCETDTIDLEKPLIYELQTDRGETSPILYGDSMYHDLLQMFSEAVNEHTKSVIPVESQLTKTKNAFSFKRASSICCNFPFCYCQ